MKRKKARKSSNQKHELLRQHYFRYIIFVAIEMLTFQQENYGEIEKVRQDKISEIYQREMFFWGVFSELVFLLLNSAKILSKHKVYFRIIYLLTNKKKIQRK